MMDNIEKAVLYWLFLILEEEIMGYNEFKDKEKLDELLLKYDLV